MAQAILKSTDVFPVGTNVSAYPRSNWTTGQLPISGAPVGSAAAGPVAVAADGSLTFAGLRTKVDYVAHASVGGVNKYVGFRATGDDGKDDDIGRAAISAATLGDNTVVAAITGKKIQVIGFGLVATAANTVKFKSGAGTDLTGGMALAANGGLSAPSDRNTVEFETAAGQALVLNLSAATQVSGWVTYKVGD